MSISQKIRGSYKTSKHLLKTKIAEFKLLIDQGSIRPAPKHLKNSIRIMKTYLIPYFSDIDVRKLTYDHINKFFKNYVYVEPSDKQRSEALCLLKNILVDVRKLDSSIIIPVFPSPIKSKRVNGKKIPTATIRMKILDNLENYKAPIMLGMMYALRECEIRALEWKQIDFEERTIEINQHLSGDVLIPGRKSQVKDTQQCFSITFELFDSAYELLQYEYNNRKTKSKVILSFQEKRSRFISEKLFIKMLGEKLVIKQVYTIR